MTATTQPNGPSLPVAFIRSGIIITCTFLFCTAFSLWLVHSFLEQQRQTYGHNYGQALANVTAYQAQEATLNQDLLSLQIILQDIAKNPAVIGATIHDVEYNLLVQGGHNPDTRRALKAEQVLGSYNAPITLHDSIAGYVTIILALPVKTDAALFAKLGLLAIFALSASLWLLRRTVFKGNFSSIQTLHLPIFSDKKSTQESSPASNTSADVKTETSAGAYIDDDFNELFQVTLHLHLRQLPRLKQQLNGSSYKQLLAQFEKQLRGVCSLYGGELIFASGSELLLRYSAESQTDASFNALCSARLLQQLTLHGGLQLELAAHIQSDSRTLCEQLKTQLPELPLSISEDLLDEKILARAQFDGEECLALEQPWFDLLSKQQRQLQRLSEG